MASTHEAQAALDVTAYTKKLPSGQYVGYIKHRIKHRTEHCIGHAPTLDTESFIAGVFADDAAARAAAVRLMHTFQSSVIAPDEDDPVAFDA